MRLLVLADEAVDADDVRAALPSEPGLDEARVLVVTPARNSSPLAFWMSDSDEAIADARAVEEATVAALQADGVRARGEVGESEPMLALSDAVATFDPDLILLLTGDDAFARDARGRFAPRVVRG
ncbi:MAG: hypothetical protein IRZ32_05790 [Solirubrobacteraceae bacterium]|nr:hypothetical protein [Solirubrobacteraceae bacterium]